MASPWSWTSWTRRFNMMIKLRCQEPLKSSSMGSADETVRRWSTMWRTTGSTLWRWRNTAWRSLTRSLAGYFWGELDWRWSKSNWFKDEPRRWTWMESLRPSTSSLAKTTRGRPMMDETGEVRVTDPPHDGADNKAMWLKRSMRLRMTRFPTSPMTMRLRTGTTMEKKTMEKLMAMKPTTPGALKRNPMMSSSWRLNNSTRMPTPRTWMPADRWHTWRPPGVLSRGCTDRRCSGCFADLTDPTTTEVKRKRKEQERTWQMAVQDWHNCVERAGCFKMFEVWTAWPLGSELSAKHCTIKPYVTAEPFFGYIDFAF